MIKCTSVDPNPAVCRPKTRPSFHQIRFGHFRFRSGFHLFKSCSAHHFCQLYATHLVLHYISCGVSKPDESVSLATKPFQDLSLFQHQLVILSNNSHNLMNWDHLFIIVDRYRQKYPEIFPHGPQSRSCRPLASGNFFSNFLPSTISATINYITSGWNSIITCSLVPAMPKRFFSFFEKNTLPPSKDSIG